DLLDTARTISVITADVIRDQGADSLSDILSNVPGISMQAGEGGAPAGDQLSIRGFSARTDIFVDGVRDFGGYTRDSYLMDQVEVAKGPGSNYTGRGSTGGSINMVTKTAQAQDFIYGTASLGTDDYKRATLDVNRQLNEGAAFRLNLMGHGADVPDRDEVENSRYGIAPTLTFGLDGDTRTILAYSHMAQDNVPDYGIPWVPSNNMALPDYANQMPPVKDSNWYGMTERDYEDIENDVFTARVEHNFSPSMAISSQLRWGDTYRDSIITAPRFNSADSTDIRRTGWKSRDQQDRIIDNLTIVTADFTTGSILHSVATGFELSDELEINYDRDITGEQPVTDLYDPTPHDHWGGTVFRTGGRARSDAFSTSFFLADSLTLDEHWLVTAGVRWDEFDLEFSDLEANGDLAEFQRTDSDWSYQASVVYKPAENGSIYAGYGTSFNPSGEGLTLVTRSGDLENVEPEKGKSLELGTKWELLDDNLLLNAAVFRTVKTNTRETDPVDSSLTILTGEQRVDGIELGAVGRINEKWNVLAGYTWMNSEVTKSVDPALVGNELSNTPENTYSIWTTYHPVPQLQLGLGTQFVDDRYSNTNNERIAPSYHLWNAMLAYEFDNGVGLRLNANNLFDEDYAGNVGGGHYIPGEGRSVILSADFQY
ncbi:MAG TPA: TonB-dependent siderophore receptor, partial [Xanthomonadales bacterium]|nr:TonB-dependent siderophore receptor [Xanthomonadales bacterium]